MASRMTSSDAKIPLPQFIKIFTSNSIPMPKAMAFTGKVYKEHNTPDTLAELDEAKLKILGIDSGEDVQSILAALHRAGYSTAGAPRMKKVKVVESPAYTPVPAGQPAASTSSPGKSRPKPVWKPSPRKRVKRGDDENEFITPSEELDEEDANSSRKDALDFGEVTDEEVGMLSYADLQLLSLQHIVINRAPVMMAWATIVAERMHFTRDEALSIASVFTEMNAMSKGAALGISGYSKSKANEAASLSGSQPYVELMGRRPLYRHQNGRWRGLANGKPAVPSSAFGYISRSFRQTMPYITGAMKLLADSYPAQELNQKAWSLYAEFRPSATEWGSRSEVHCKTMLDLRCSSATATLASETQGNPTNEVNSKLQARETTDVKPSTPPKKRKFASVEEYEAFLDSQEVDGNIS